jgi:hypothetical protein
MGYRRKQVDPEFLGRGRILKWAQQYVTCNHSLFSVLLLSPAYAKTTKHSAFLFVLFYQLH